MMNERTSHYIKNIGPITTKMFATMQTMMQDCNEAQRYECLYNLLVMMKKQDENA